MKMDMVTVTLENGMVLRGTPEQVMEVVKGLGFKTPVDLRKYYNSESKGWIKISDMETTHLKNAILKMYRAWVLELAKIEEPAVLVKAITDGIADMTWGAMLIEYSRRRAE